MSMKKSNCSRNPLLNPEILYPPPVRASSRLPTRSDLLLSSLLPPIIPQSPRRRRSVKLYFVLLSLHAKNFFFFLEQRASCALGIQTLGFEPWISNLFKSIFHVVNRLNMLIWYFKVYTTWRVSNDTIFPLMRQRNGPKIEHRTS